MDILKIITSIVLLSLGFNFLNIADDLTVLVGLIFIGIGLWIIFKPIKQLFIYLTNSKNKKDEHI
jgi:hypothetical protein